MTVRALPINHRNNRTGRTALSGALALSLIAGACVLPSATLAQDGQVLPAPSGIVPLPDPFDRPLLQDPENPLAIPGKQQSLPAPDDDNAVIGGSLDELPAPVRLMREKLIEATRNADYDALKSLLGTGGDQTQLALGGSDGDPIDQIRSQSGDEDGFEILAILEEVLEAGYAVYDKGTPQEMYVWPYFVATSLDDLTPKQKVELFKLVTSGDYEDMRSFGAYVFYRVGISPDGKWRFFVAGD